MNIWECKVCGFIYEEDKGLPEKNILPNTQWEDIPKNWICPDCGTFKTNFEKLSIPY